MTERYRIVGIDVGLYTQKQMDKALAAQREEITEDLCGKLYTHNPPLKTFEETIAAIRTLKDTPA